MKVVNLSATRTQCLHDWNDSFTCNVCGETCEHPSNVIEATCNKQALCEICRKRYGALNPEKATLMFEGTWATTKTTYAFNRTCCDASDVPVADHELGNDNVCDICEYTDVVYDNTVPEKVEIPENDQFEGGTVVRIEEITAGTIYNKVKWAVRELAENYLALEFAAERNGSPVQPDGKITVKINIPDSFGTKA